MKILYFGMISEITGKALETVDTPNFELMQNVDQIRMKLQEMYPELSKVSFSIAINQQLESGDIKLTNQSEIALLPPFAGG